MFDDVKSKLKPSEEVEFLVDDEANSDFTKLFASSARDPLGAFAN